MTTTVIRSKSTHDRLAVVVTELSATGFNASVHVYGVRHDGSTCMLISYRYSTEELAISKWESIDLTAPKYADPF